ncbi:MAG TPA: acyl carrier protein [Polyangiales bacterium]|nr:acyl carrier protein [Polyangiales bacterium]
MTEEAACAATIAVLVEMSPVLAARISPASQLVSDLGVDSMMLALLLVGLEARLGIRVPPGGESRFANVGTVAEFAERFCHATRVAVQSL